MADHPEHGGAHRAPRADPSALSQMLLDGTSVIHRLAERRPFMVAFFKGEIGRDAYIEWLARQATVYAALEETSDALRDDPVVGRMHSPELTRSAAIERDLAVLAGPDWRDRAKPSAAADAYAERIRGVASEFPPAFVAHQWLRYLGNVLGQELLRKLTAKVIGTEDGMDFYRFPEIADGRTFLRAYHERMNSMPLDDDGKRLVVEEGDRAFKLNIALTDELGAEFGFTSADQAETEALIEKLEAEHP